MLRRFSPSYSREGQPACSSRRTGPLPGPMWGPCSCLCAWARTRRRAQLHTAAASATLTAAALAAWRAASPRSSASPASRRATWASRGCCCRPTPSQCTQVSVARVQKDAQPPPLRRSISTAGRLGVSRDATAPARCGAACMHAQNTADGRRHTLAACSDRLVRRPRPGSVPLFPSLFAQRPPRTRRPRRRAA
jgi:hypothetical protein